MRSVFGLAILLAFAGPALADLGFPDLVKLPRQIVVDSDQKLVEETLGEAEFAVNAEGTLETRRGRHLMRWFRYAPLKGEAAPGYDNGTEERIFNAISAEWLKAGWRLVKVDDAKSDSTFIAEHGGKTAWLRLKMDAPQAQVHVEYVEAGGGGPGVSFPAPAARPEKVADADDLPYLPPPKGAKRLGAGRGQGPMDVGKPGGGEEMLVGQGAVTRNYQGPAALSELQFTADYRAALEAAGWTILWPAADDPNRYGGLAAHYIRDGRDIWVRLAYENGANLWFSVADAGAEDLGARLDKECHLPLYGVFFDFNKATLKPESEPTLARVAALVKARGKAAFEVQGHTDNVGTEAYNAKLSEARAGAVRGWLVSHEIEGKRLSAKGYGKSQPVADNGTDAGRARNRRVEIATKGCGK